MKAVPIAVCLTLLAWSTSHAAAEETIVAMLGQQPVYSDEYAFHADQLRTEVASRLMQQHGLRQTPDFWTTELDGVTPEATLRRETLSRIARFRVVQALAVEEGLLDAAQSYRDMVAAFQQENNRRQEMKAAGKVFYGPAGFRQEVYFDIRLEQLLRALQKAYQARTADLDEAEVKIQLEALIRDWMNVLLD